MSDASTNTEALRRDVGTLRTKLFYGFGSIAFGIKDNGFQTILLLFYNQVMHLPPASVAGILFMAMCADAVFDPIVGQFSDNLRSRWGRRHPLLYLSALPVAVSYLLLWNPPHWSHGALLVYLFVVAVVVRTFISFYEIPSSALNPELTDDYDQRTALQSYRTFFGWTGGMTMYLLALGVFLRPDKTHAVGQLNEHGYSLYGITAAVLMFCAILISALGTHKFIPILRKPPERAQSIADYARQMAATLYNRAFAILMLAQIAFGAATGLVFAMAIYLGTYFWELSSTQIVTLGFGTVVAFILAFVIALPVGKRLGKRVGAVSLFATGLFISIFPILLRLLGVFLPNSSPLLVPVLFTFGAISGAMTIGSSILMGAMLADVVEDSELKTKRRSEGLFYAGSSFMAKAVSGLGILLTGLLLSAVGFPDNAVPGHVDPHVIRNIALVYLPAVVVLYGIGIWIISRFPIDRKDHEENLRKLVAEAAYIPASEHP
ncbi:MAG TPA: MFS transporter [Rhizomicrobium sp.]|nr:MFS transporter [Rhizomicrobium sp.]